MDHKIRCSRELAMQIAHAKSILSTCRVAVPRIEINDNDFTFIAMRIKRMIAELQGMQRYLEKKEYNFEVHPVHRIVSGDF